MSIAAGRNMYYFSEHMSPPSSPSSAPPKSGQSRPAAAKAEDSTPSLSSAASAVLSVATVPDGTYLNDLGQRVRRIRAIRGMSRKVLAKTSGISERYIAQLEGGTGNVSIVLLRRISRTLGMPVEDLVMDTPPDWLAVRELLRTAAPERIARARSILAGQGLPLNMQAEKLPSDRIALIGLRGAGKSTLGEIAARKLGWKFVELNKVIERSLGLTITEIYRLYSQDGYRRAELAALRELINTNEPMVLATGGGIVAEPLSFELLLSSFYTVWVKTTPEEHMKRVRDQGDLRPTASDRNDRTAMQELIAILTNREPLYARANATIDTSGATLERSTGDLLAAISRAGQ